MFDKNGHVTMWGRSSIYRNAATAPLAANFNLMNPEANPGLSRRIASGALMQFFGRDDMVRHSFALNFLKIIRSGLQRKKMGYGKR